MWHLLALSQDARIVEHLTRLNIYYLIVLHCTVNDVNFFRVVSSLTEMSPSLTVLLGFAPLPSATLRRITIATAQFVCSAHRRIKIGLFCQIVNLNPHGFIFPSFINPKCHAHTHCTRAISTLCIHTLKQRETSYLPKTLII